MSTYTVGLEIHTLLSFYHLVTHYYNQGGFQTEDLEAVWNQHTARLHLVSRGSPPIFSSKAGSKGLIAHLRTMFATFGVPEILSSDEGPEFMSAATEDFLACCGVKHR